MGTEVKVSPRHRDEALAAAPALIERLETAADHGTARMEDAQELMSDAALVIRALLPAAVPSAHLQSESGQ